MVKELYSGPQLTGTPSQIEWAEAIRLRVTSEFNRVEGTLKAATLKQSNRDRADTNAIIAILQEKHLLVMANQKAGYYIKNWQEVTDQVRQLLGEDLRFKAIRAAKENRRCSLGKKQEQETYTMTIRPLYDRIIVKRSSEQESTRNGIIIPDSAKEKPQEGDVIAVGLGKRMDDGQLIPLDVKTGDRILFGKYSGSETKVDGTEYTIMREEDVLAILSSTSN